MKSHLAKTSFNNMTVKGGEGVGGGVGGGCSDYWKWDAGYWGCSERS